MVGDQALISASNFLGMIVAARAMSVTEFGIYALAYTGLWAMNGVQSSLITQPHSVLASHTDVIAYRRFTSATALMQIALSAALGIPIVVAGIGAMVAGFGPVLLVVGFALLGWQAQEFVRRVLYFEGRATGVIVIDVISYGGQLLALIGLAWAGDLTVASGLLVAALTSIAAAAVGVVLLRTTLFHRPMAGAVAMNLAHGRWLLGAEIGAFICMSSYPFLLAATAGSEPVADYAAAMLILNPLNVIWFAAGTALPIQLSRAAAVRGDEAARGELWRVYLFSAPVVGAFCLAASVLAGPLLLFLYGPAYAGFGWVVAGAAVFRFIGFHSHLLSIGLRARDQTRSIFTGYAFAVPFSMVVGTILTITFGIAGALLAMIGAQIIWTTIWARAYFARTRSAGTAAG
ncbi:MAG: lipopolysaccharide biosynthesis protein [Candidatus Limnocylindrales bacterium]